MRNFKINPLVLAMAVTALPIGAFAQDAQNAGEDTIEEVLVTGSFRDSLQNAMNIKRQSATAVDSIVADDIASFPDNNLAESMQRIPGVAISRSGGEGRQISVRGLSPEFTRVRINGMEGVATTGGTDATGGNNRSRGFDFNTFPSELFTSLAVTKTASAEIDEGSLGATVDLRAPRAFDFNDFVFSAGAKGGYNDASEEIDPQFNFILGNTFADGKLGAMLSFAHAERTIKDSGTSTVRWSKAATEAYGFVNGNPVDASHEVNQAFHPRIPRYDIYNHELTRDGATLSLQWRPSDATEFSLDGLWAKYDATREELFMQGSLNGSQANAMNVVEYEIQGESLVYAKTTGARLLAENRFDSMSTEFNQINLTGKHDFTDSFRINGLVGTSKSDFNNPIQNTVIMQANNQAFTWDYRKGNKSPLDFSEAAALSDSTLWTINSVRQRPQSTVNEYDNATLNLEYDLTENLTLKGGVAYKEFSMETGQYAYTNGEGAGCTPTPAAGCGVDLQSNPDFIMSYNAGSNLGGTWFLPNRAAVMDAYDRFDLPMSINRGSSYFVSEETVSSYLQLDFNFDIGSVPVRGNVGARQFETDQSSSSWVQLNGNWEQITVDHSYDDLLPSINVVVEPFEDFLIRAGASDGISRAGLGSLVSNTSVSVAGTQRSVSAGNPYLEPTKARSYDLGFEWYFAEGALLNVAFFRKEIESHVQGLREGRTYTDLGLPVELAVEACTKSLGYGPDCNENLEWSYSAPLNGPGGDLDGYEISYQQPFTFLPGFLSNFGFIGSYTDVESEMDYLDRDGNVQNTATLLNLSPSSSATIYWENDVFSARVSVAKRDGYLTNAVTDQNGNYQNGTYGTTNVDANLSYQMNDNWKFTFEALNLTDEADDQWVGSDDPRLSYYHKTGKQYYLGVQYKY